MNDSAAKLLDVASGPAGLAPSDDLSSDLLERLAQGIVYRSRVLVWSGSHADPTSAPSFFPDLTAWECSDSSFHLEDLVAVTVEIVEDAPVISESDQRVLLQHGITFALRFSRLVHELEVPTPVRCIVSANETNATFRFHQIRPNETWNQPDLDEYRLEKIVVLDVKPDREP